MLMYLGVFIALLRPVLYLHKYCSVIYVIYVFFVENSSITFLKSQKGKKVVLNN